MHVLYVDESGSAGSSAYDYFVLSGIAVHERAIFQLIRQVDNLVAGWGLSTEPNRIELHASRMYQGSGVWRRRPRADRERMMNAALALLSRTSGACAFGVAVHKSAIAPDDDPVLYAFAEICRRFDRHLSRIQGRARFRERQRGLMLLDESPNRAKLQQAAQDLRDGGASQERIRNLPELPIFVDSKAHRIMQLADLVAYALWRRYEYQDGRFFEPIAGLFDAAGGVIHGLVHYKPPQMDCYCPACMSRRYGETGQRLQV